MKIMHFACASQLFASVVVWHAPSSSEKTIDLQENFVGGNDQPSLLIHGNIPSKNVSTKGDWNETSATIQLCCKCPFLDGSRCSITLSRATYDAGLSCVLDQRYNTFSVKTGGSCTCGAVCNAFVVSDDGEGRDSVVGLRKPSCGDAGKYTCETRGPSGYTAKVMASLEMLPGLPEITTSQEKGGSHTFQLPIALWIICRVFSTVPVDLKWRLHYPDGWDLLRSGYADVHVTKPSINERCEQPWESKLYRELDTHDAGRKYQCFAEYKYRNATYKSSSARYTLKVTGTPKGSDILQHSRLLPSFQQLPDRIPPPQQSSLQRLSGQQTPLQYPPPRQSRLQQFLSQQPPHQQQPQKRQLPAHEDNEAAATVPNTSAANAWTTGARGTTRKVVNSDSRGTVHYAILISISMLVTIGLIFVAVVVVVQSGRFVVQLVRRLALRTNERRSRVTGGLTSIPPEQTPPIPSQPAEQAPQPLDQAVHSPEQALHSPEQAPQLPVLSHPSPEQAPQLPALIYPSPEQSPQIPVLINHLPLQHSHIPTQTTESPDETRASPV